MLLVYRERTTS